MLKNYNVPDLAWKFTSFGFMLFLAGAGWSISQAKIYELQLANYKLAVGSAMNDVAAASTALEDAAKSLPPKQQKKIQALTDEANEKLEIVADELDPLLIE